MTLRKLLEEIEPIQKEAQEIDNKLQKYMRENRQVFSKHSKDQDLIKDFVELQKGKISREIEKLEEDLNHLIQPLVDGEMGHLPKKWSSAESSDAPSNTSQAVGEAIQEFNSLDYKRKKNFSERIKDGMKGDFKREKTDLSVIIIAGVKAVFKIVPALLQDSDENLAIQCDEEIQKTQKQVTELRREAETYYSRFGNVGRN